MEIKQYLYLIRKWAWLLALGLLLGSGAAYLFSTFQQPVYESTAKVMISQPSKDQLSDLGYLSGQQMVQTYSELLLTSPILNEVSENIGTEVKPEMVSVQQISDTNILSVSVEDTDPNRAALIADALIDVLVKQNEEMEASRFQASEESLQTQISIVQEQIDNLESEIKVSSEETLQNQLTSVEEQISRLQTEIIDLQLEISALQGMNEAGNPNAISSLDLETQTQIQQIQLDLEQRQGMLDLYQEIYFNLLSNDSNGGSNSLGTNSQYQNTLALYRQIYSSLLSDYENVRLSRLENTVLIINVEPAVPETVPVRPKIMINTLLGGVVGVMIAGGIIFLIEYLDDKVKSVDELEKLSPHSIIGYIPTYPHASMNGHNGSKVYVQEHPRSPVADSFRSLRTNLEFSGVAHATKTIVITSAEPQEGKSSVAANLASILVQGGSKVFLVDADLRKPNVHRYFKFINRVGLTEYFCGQANLAQTFHYVDEEKQLVAIPSGKLPPNPAELLASEKMNDLLSQLEKIADYIILDTPPLMVTDPVVLSSKADGVLLVVEPGKTKLAALKTSLEQLDRAQARVLGVVLNNLSRQNGYYFGNYYSTAYYQAEEQEAA